MFMWCYAKADQMQDHTFTDDVAITFAWTKKNAIKKFGKLYSNIEDGYVWRIGFFKCIKNIAVLTDY